MCAASARDCSDCEKGGCRERTFAGCGGRAEQLEVCDAGLHLKADRAVAAVAVVIGLDGNEDTREGEGREDERGAKSRQNAPRVHVRTKNSAECQKHSVYYSKMVVSSANWAISRTAVGERAK